MDVLAMLRSDLLQAAGIYTILVLFAAVSLLVMKSQAARQAGHRRGNGRRPAGRFSAAVGRITVAVREFAGRRRPEGPVTRGVRVAGASLARGVRVGGGPLLRGARVAGVSLRRGVRAAGGPVVRAASARLALLFAFGGGKFIGSKANPEGEPTGNEAQADRWTAVPPSILAATAGAGPLARRARELVRYAGEISVAAERAADMAEKARQEWLAAQEQLEEAWQAFETTEADARRFDKAAVLPLPHAPKTPAEYAFRERYLHRVAMAACSRRQLSALELSDALAHRDGWDPKRHPAEQEVVLRRAVRDCMWAGYRAATKRERAAWRTAEMAQEAKRSLRREAAEASALARQAASGKPLALATWSADDFPAPLMVDAPSWTATPASVESTTLILPIATAVTRPLPTRVRSAALEAGRQAAQRASGAKVSLDKTTELPATPRILESLNLAAQTKEQAEAQKGAAGRLLARGEQVTLVGYRDSARQGAEPLAEKEDLAPEGQAQDAAQGEESQDVGATAGRRGRGQQGRSQEGRSQESRSHAGRRGGAPAVKGGARAGEGGAPVAKGATRASRGAQAPKKERREGVAGGTADAMTTATLVLPVIVAKKPYAATRSRRRG